MYRLRLRVFGHIDQVLVDAFVGQLLRLTFHPGRDEGGNVEMRLAIQL